MTKVSQSVGSFEVERHGAEFADYWQGAGTAHTGYGQIATGTGSTEFEAYQDALELIRQEGVEDVDSLELRVRLSGEQFDDDTTARDSIGIDDHKALDSEPMFRVSIRYNLEEMPEDIDCGMQQHRRVWIDTTRRVLAEMLTESTGTHFLDSGGTYGRNWQRNQAAVQAIAVEHPAQFFESLPESTVDFRYGIELTHHVYHWLAERLEYNPALDAAFRDFAEPRESNCWLEDMSDFVEEHLPECGVETCGLYGESGPMTVNTYNHESSLSQVLQFLYWEDSDGCHVLLQIHGGCDVRGGYTRPRAFDVGNQHDQAALFCHADGAIGCSECGAYWRTDDTCHFYRDGCAGCGAGTQLEDFDRIELSDVEFYRNEDGELILIEKDTAAPEDTDIIDGSELTPDDILASEELRGTLVVDADGNGYCPDCGHNLVASPF